MATTIPTTKTLQLVYPGLNKLTAQLCRNVMHNKLDPLAYPRQFPATAALHDNALIPSPPRLLRMAALAELMGVLPPYDPDTSPLLDLYGVRQRNIGTRTTPHWFYWLHSATSDVQTLCSIPPPAPPSRLAVKRDPWLYKNQITTERYRIAAPARLIKQLTRKHNQEQ